MNDIISKKFNALKNILNDYENYKGEKSHFEFTIMSLKNKLGELEFAKLYNSFEKYQNYIISAFANTPLVRVKVEQDNLDKIFAELE